MKECENINAGNLCNIDSCKVETNFIIETWYAVQIFGTTDQSLKHDGTPPFDFDGTCVAAPVSGGGRVIEHQCCATVPYRVPFIYLDGRTECCEAAEKIFHPVLNDCCSDGTVQTIC